MSSRCRHRTGFTLIELLIVIGLIATLSAIAIPAFMRYQLRARTTEALTHLKAIATTETAYFSEFGTYVSVPTPTPATLPRTLRLPWPNGTAFDMIGWRPEGGVQFQYMVSADAAGGSGPLLRFTVEAGADLDGDFAESFFAFVRPAAGVGGLPGALPGTTCVASGVYTPSSGGPTSLNAAGPCDVDSGRTRF